MTKVFSLMTSLLFVGATILAQTPEFNITKLSHPDIRDYVYGFAEAADGSVYFFNGDDEVFVSRNDTIQPTGFNCPSFCRIQNISLDADGNIYVATPAVVSLAAVKKQPLQGDCIAAQLSGQNNKIAAALRSSQLLFESLLEQEGIEEIDD